MSGNFNRELTRTGDQMLDKLMSIARATLPLTDEQILASIEMIAVIPQNAGSMVFHKELEPAVARQVCHTLVLSSLTALRSMPRTDRAG